MTCNLLFKSKNRFCKFCFYTFQKKKNLNISIFDDSNFIENITPEANIFCQKDLRKFFIKNLVFLDFSWWFFKSHWVKRLTRYCVSSSIKSFFTGVLHTVRSPVNIFSKHHARTNLVKKVSKAHKGIPNRCVKKCHSEGRNGRNFYDRHLLRLSKMW